MPGALPVCSIWELSRPCLFMPLFTSASGFQINGGNFFDVAGDMHFRGMPAMPMIGQDTDLLAAPGIASGYGKEFGGVERNNREVGAARMSPYDASRRPQILGRSFSDFDEQSSSMTPSSASLRVSIPRSSLPYLQGLQLPRLNPYTWEDATESCLDGRPALELQIPSDSHPWYNRRLEYQTIINGGTFVDGNVNHIHGERGLHILQRVTAGDAFHDSIERYPQPKCHPQTRLEMLTDLWEWSSSDDLSSSVLWLYGPAGAGKSAIAQSFCQRLEAGGVLGASFFFKRGNLSRGNAKRLFPTIAYQLALVLPEFKRAISQIIEENPSVIERSLSTQLQRLIVDPCRRLDPMRTVTIVIDGLDECEGQSIQQEVLLAIGSAIHEGPLPFRFFIASRSEDPIHDIFTGPLNDIHRPLNIHQSFLDVHNYLLVEFARIHREHCETMFTVPSPWPPPEILDQLVHKSSGYFIYASTVISYIDDKNFRPTDRLKAVLGGGTQMESEFGSPFASLDQLYTQILSDVPRPRQLRILTFLSTQQHHLLEIFKIEQLIDLQPGDVRLTLRGLKSLINTPSRDDVRRRITVHHASFLDFLHDPTRSGAFYVDSPEQRAELVRQFLKAFTYTYADASENRTGRDHVAW
ncbi:hypothetical protein B0H13DRAFT_1705464 [Mycena leptocephala]|nr:hypothetical protein B0H13DRAFT_1705464 [Mycena leptocephala]